MEVLKNGKARMLTSANYKSLQDIFRCDGLIRAILYLEDYRTISG